MKTLLAILLSFIVTEAPVLAIHGGYSLGTAQSAEGTYAGVLIPIAITNLNNVLATGTTDFGTNSLGLFTLSIPGSGVGSGSVVIFSGNAQTVGGINALPDPNNVGGIVGVLEAQQFTTEFSSTSGLFGNQTIQVITAQASGSVFCQTAQSNLSNSPTGINLSGTSNVTFSVPDVFNNDNLVPTQQIEYSVEGFQQSAAAAATSGTF